ncbi:surf-like protein [Entomophthora muscae]|uniref:Surf-like protein n=1 Tax=Entomophthora muscae TaxID=34485 RepID=A0ACC2UH74_9FUNG|nr:surf-like protein [Entomophthora muscae]
MFNLRGIRTLLGPQRVLSSRSFMSKGKNNRKSIGLFTETIESNRERDPNRKFKIALLGTIPVITLYLGWWQIQRLEWKQNLLATISSRIKAEPLVLNSIMLDSEIPEEWEYRTFLARGEFLHDRELLLGPRTFDGQIGYYVFTPFRLDNGYIVLVRRGWVSKEKKDPRTRTATLDYSTVTIKTQLRRGEKGNYFSPANVPDQNQWYYVNVQEMAEYTGSLPILVEVITDESQYKMSKWIEEGTPVPRAPEVHLSNNHAQYTVVWLSLSVLTTIMTIMFARGGARRLPSSNHHPLTKRRG